MVTIGCARTSFLFHSIQRRGRDFLMICLSALIEQLKSVCQSNWGGGDGGSAGGGFCSSSSSSPSSTSARQHEGRLVLQQPNSRTLLQPSLMLLDDRSTLLMYICCWLRMRLPHLCSKPAGGQNLDRRFPKRERLRHLDRLRIRRPGKGAQAITAMAICTCGDARHNVVQKSAVIVAGVTAIQRENLRRLRGPVVFAMKSDEMRQLGLKAAGTTQLGLDPECGRREHS